MDPIQNSKPKRHKESKLDQYRSVLPSPEYIHELAMTGLSSRGSLFAKIINSITNDPNITEQEKITMICELLYTPAKEMKDDVIESASFDIKVNDAVVAVYGATIYPLLRRMGGLVALSDYVNLNNGVILSGGTSWNSIVPAATKDLVNKEANADADREESEEQASTLRMGVDELKSVLLQALLKKNPSSEEQSITAAQKKELRRKEKRMVELTIAKKYWNSRLTHSRLTDILDVVPEVFNSLFGKFSVSDTEINTAVIDVLNSREQMEAEEFHEPQTSDLYNYWVIFSSCETITPDLMSRFINEFCKRTVFSLSKVQKSSLKEYAEGLFMLQPDEIQKKDARKIMKRIVKYCSTDEFRAAGRTFSKLEYYYALYWHENNNKRMRVPAYSPKVTGDLQFRKWLAKYIKRERHIEYITENITEAELMELLHKRSKLHKHADSENGQPSNIYLEQRSTNTRENADETLKILQEIMEQKPGVKKLIIISDWQYLLRQVLTTKKAIADLIAKRPGLEKTLGQIEVMGWPADRVRPSISTRFRTGQDLIDAGLLELSKLITYEDDVEEMIYSVKESEKCDLADLGVYIGDSDKIGNEPGECIPLEQYIGGISKDSPDDQEL